MDFKVLFTKGQRVVCIKNKMMQPTENPELVLNEIYTIYEVKVLIQGKRPLVFVELEEVKSGDEREFNYEQTMFAPLDEKTLGLMLKEEIDILEKEDAFHLTPEDYV